MDVNIKLLKELRIAKGLSIPQVASELGFKSPQGYYYKETGASQLSAIELGTLADLYGVEADALLTRDGDEACANY